RGRRRRRTQRGRHAPRRARPGRRRTHGHERRGAAPGRPAAPARGRRNALGREGPPDCHPGRHPAPGHQRRCHRPAPRSLAGGPRQPKGEGQKMTAKAIARQDDRLTPEERLRLILAASGRGGETERDRLVQASDRIHLTMPDYSPYANAFQDVCLMVYIEMLNESARYMESLALSDQEGFADAGDDELANRCREDDEPETADLDFA